MEKQTTYIKLKHEIKQRIIKSEWLPGEKIPSSRDFATFYSCSVNTIEKAIKELESEGLLEREIRKGTIVARNELSVIKPKNGLVSAIIPGIDNPLWATALRGIEDRLHHHGMNIIPASHDGSMDKFEILIKNSISRNVDGIIISPMAKTIKEHDYFMELVNLLKVRGIAVVLLDRYIAGMNLPYVSSDNTKGAYSLMQILISNGHKNIAFIRNSSITTIIERLMGYKRALQDNDILVPEDLDIFIPTEHEDFKLEMDSFSEKLAVELSKKNITAIFAANDQVARAAIQASNILKLKIPQNISLVSYDVSNLKLCLPFKITGMDQPFYSMGNVAADLIFKQINYIKDDFTTMGYICESELTFGDSVTQV